MNPDERARRVRALFDRTLDLTGPERADVLERECPDDPALRSEVRRLLGQHDKAEVGDFLGQPGVATPPPKPMPRGHHVRCPHCRGPIEIVEEREPALVTCPSCGSSFRVNQAGTSSWRPDRERFARFEILLEVGMGSYGTVFKARDPKLRRIVALKVPRDVNVPSADGSGGEGRDRFFREARNAAQLRHESIVPVFEVDEHENIPYIVSEFVDGVSLAQRLGDPLHMPNFREAASLIADIAGALDYAHERGVIHRDIKPDNILIDASGRPRVTDFGLAKRDVGEISISVDGRPLGSPSYMSPEQAEGKAHAADARSDVYSLGVMLYQMLTGALPFQGTWSMLLHHHLHTEPRPLRTLNNHIPRDLETICLKALEKSPGRRYQTAGSFADDLRLWLRGEPIGARPVGRAERVLRWCRRKPVAAAAVLLLVAVSVVTSLLAVREWQFGVDQLRAKREADELRGKADGRRIEAEDNLYANNIALLAREDVPDGADVDRFEALLEQCPPRLRGWEWNYLRRRQPSPRMILRGHKAGVYVVAYSPDGTRIASADDVGGVRVWDAETGAAVGDFRGHDGGVLALSYSPDGATIVTAGRDKVTRIWDAETGRERLALKGHSEPVSALSFSPDGKFVATGGWDGLVLVHDTGDGRLLHSLRGHKGYINSLDITPDGRYLASGAETVEIGYQAAPAEIKVWNIESGKLIHERGVRGGGMLRLAFARDESGAKIAKDEAADIRDESADHLVGRLDISTGQGQLGWLRRATGTGGTPSVAVLGLWHRPEGAVKMMHLGFFGKVIGLAPAELNGFKAHPDWISGVAFQPSGKEFATAGNDRTVRIWDVAEVRRVSYLLFGKHPLKVVDVLLFPDGRRLVTVGGGQARVWETASRRLLYALRCDDAKLSRDGRTLLTIRRGVLSVRDAETGRERGRWEGARGNIAQPFPGTNAIPHFSPDNRVVVFEDAEVVPSDRGGAIREVTVPMSLRVHEAETGRLIHKLRGYRGAVAGVTFSPDGRRLATTGGRYFQSEWRLEPGEAKLWDLETGKLVHELKGLENTGMGISFSPDGRWVASGGADQTARVWDASSGELVHTLRGHSGWVFDVVFSPDGRKIATRGDDYSVRVWEVSTGRELYTLRGQKYRYFQSGEDGSSVLRFSPDSRRLLTAVTVNPYNPRPGELRLYDADSGLEYLRLHGTVFDDNGDQIPSPNEEVHKGPILAAEFSPDGGRIISGGLDGYARIWDARDPSILEPVTARPPQGDLPPPPMPNGAGGVTLFDHQFDYFSRDTSVRDVAFQPAGGGLLASIGNDHVPLRLRDPVDGSRAITIFMPPDPWCMAFRHDGTEVAIAGSAGILSLARLDGAAQPRVLKAPGETTNLYEVAYSVDGTLLAAGGDSKLIHLWDPVSGTYLRNLRGHNGPILGLSFRAGGEQLASASQDRVVKIWDLKSSQVIRPIEHPAEVSDLAYSPDGSLLATACWDRTVRLWDAETGQPVRSFNGHDGRVGKVRFSPDGRRLASCGADRTVRLWEVATAKPLATYTEHDATVTGLAFSSDGKWLASSAEDGTVEVRLLPAIGR